eukprot:COSAG06_NODE_240_length_19339_cov_16.770582_9_plen_42_part_00
MGVLVRRFGLQHMCGSVKWERQQQHRRLRREEEEEEEEGGL